MEFLIFIDNFCIKQTEINTYILKLLLCCYAYSSCIVCKHLILLIRSVINNYSGSIDQMKDLCYVLGSLNIMVIQHITRPFSPSSMSQAGYTPHQRMELGSSLYSLWRPQVCKAKVFVIHTLNVWCNSLGFWARSHLAFAFAFAFAFPMFSYDVCRHLKQVTSQVASLE